MEDVHTFEREKRPFLTHVPEPYTAVERGAEEQLREIE